MRGDDKFDFSSTLALLESDDHDEKNDQKAVSTVHSTNNNRRVFSGFTVESLLFAGDSGDSGDSVDLVDKNLSPLSGDKWGQWGQINPNDVIEKSPVTPLNIEKTKANYAQRLSVADNLELDDTLLQAARHYADDCRRATIPDPVEPDDPCPACAGGHYAQLPAGWLCVICNSVELTAPVITLTVSGGRWPDATAESVETAKPLPNDDIASAVPMITCVTCRHFQPDQLGDGSGIGRCGSGEHERRHGLFLAALDSWEHRGHHGDGPTPPPPMYPGMMRLCDAFEETP